MNATEFATFETRVQAFRVSLPPPVANDRALLFAHALINTAIEQFENAKLIEITDSGRLKRKGRSSVPVFNTYDPYAESIRPQPVSHSHHSNTHSRAATIMTAYDPTSPPPPPPPEAKPSKRSSVQEFRNVPEKTAKRLPSISADSQQALTPAKKSRSRQDLMFKPQPPPPSNPVSIL